MDREILEFLFIGPLFSIWKRLNNIERLIMGINDDIQAYATRVDAYATSVGEANSRVESAVAVVRQEIADLKNVPPGETADWTPVDTALSHLDDQVTAAGTAAADVESLEPPMVTEEPPVEEPPSM
jgi:hypothetical protein